MDVARKGYLENPIATLEKNIFSKRGLGRQERRHSFELLRFVAPYAGLSVGPFVWLKGFLVVFFPLENHPTPFLITIYYNKRFYLVDLLIVVVLYWIQKMEHLCLCFSRIFENGVRVKEFDKHSGDVAKIRLVLDCGIIARRKCRHVFVCRCVCVCFCFLP